MTKTGTFQKFAEFVKEHAFATNELPLILHIHIKCLKQQVNFVVI